MEGGHVEYNRWDSLTLAPIMYLFMLLLLLLCVCVHECVYVCVCVTARATQCITFGIHQEWMSLGLEIRSLFCNVQVVNCLACRYIHHLICSLHCSGSHIVMSTYRDKSDVLNYITAGGMYFVCELYCMFM